MSTDIPSALRQWRAGHTARVAAASLGVELSTYQGWENGRVNAPSFAAILRRAILVPIEVPTIAPNAKSPPP